ncbi:MAG: 23S rRNA (adenine(2503)-C(2))-methyltransferase RlmN [Muribaculaceae bacterium]|nr:23S rRNA (adenine(2503)-C(2))-methyltransferase RlmN [Muribaculaceae bacterium]
MKKLLGLTLAQLGEVAAEVGLRSFAAKQMAQWLYVKRVTDIDQMTDLPKRARALLAEKGYTVGRTAPLGEARSSDGTVKYLFEGRAGRNVEAVYIPDKDRATLCVSSQAGCRMGCRFCMTGQGGWQGNLDAGDIINQILSIKESASLTNIVFMGMGEPADNLDAVLPAIEILTAPWGMAWSPRRITVSTIGKLDGLRRFLDDTQVHIAISIHSPFALERERLMPVEKAFPMRDILPVLRDHDFAHQRRLSMEYTMFAGLNDSDRHADALARLLKGTHARVNLIRFHRTPGFEGAPADRATMERFRDRLNDSGITATIRASRGEDIMAACGMLAGKAASQSNDNQHDETR